MGESRGGREAAAQQPGIQPVLFEMHSDSSQLRTVEDFGSTTYLSVILDCGCTHLLSLEVAGREIVVQDHRWPDLKSGCDLCDAEPGVNVSPVYLPPIGSYSGGG